MCKLAYFSALHFLALRFFAFHLLALHLLALRFFALHFLALHVLALHFFAMHFLETCFSETVSQSFMTCLNSTSNVLSLTSMNGMTPSQTTKKSLTNTEWEVLIGPMQEFIHERVHWYVKPQVNLLN